MHTRSRRLGALPLPILICLALALGLAAAAIPGLAPPARAAQFSNGLWWGGWGAGNYVTSTGELAYCVEPGANPPLGDQQAEALVSELPAYSLLANDPRSGWQGRVSSGPVDGDALRRMNYLISTHGQTSDDATAAAVQLAVWMLRDDPGIDAWLDYHLALAEAHGGQAVIQRAEQLVAEARDEAHAPTAQPGTLVLAGNGFGLGLLEHPLGTTGISLVGAVFDGGATSLTADPAAAGSAAWQALLHPSGWQRRHEVRASASWTLSGAGWPAQLLLHPPTIEGQQRLGGGVAGPVVETVSGTLEAVFEIDAQFSPVLSTAVSQRFLPAGHPFSDRVRFAVASGSAPWAARDGADGTVEYAPVVAEGTMYGPFSAPQPPHAAPPTGAPVAGTARVVADRGPGEYAIVSTQSPDEAGYFYWVWEIREERQLAEIRDAELLPVDYRFTDAFGLLEEGQVSPTVLRWSTELERRELRPDDLVLRDRVTVSLHGGAWLRDDQGRRISARLRLTVYRSDARPQRQAAPPAGAEEIAVGHLDIDAPGGPFAAGPIRLPAGTRGWVTVRACLLASDQPEAWRGHVEEWCDDYGVPAETARILPGRGLVRTGAGTAPVADGASLAAASATGIGALLLLASGIVRRCGSRKRRDTQ